MDKTVIRLVGAGIVAALTLAATSVEQGFRVAIGGGVGVLSFVLMTLSRRQLGRAFSILPQAKALVTTGLYSRIQDPMYVFLDLFLAGVIVACDSPVLLWVWGILVLLQTVQARREEKVLAASFGPEYAGYKRRTWF